MWPGLISAGASLLGGLFNQSNQEKINQENIANQQAINAQNIAAQTEFAKNGIQWKVDDAKAAGINPLAALGASTTSFSNLVGANAQASSGLGDAISKGGQDIGRALQDTMAAGDQHAIKMAKLQETHGELENTLLASQIARYHNAGAGGPPTAMPGQSYVGGLAGQQPATDLRTASGAPVKVTPATVAPVSGVQPGAEPGANPAISYIRVGENSWLPLSSEAYQHRSSNDTLSNMADFVGRRLAPITNMPGLMDPPSGVKLGPNETWVYEPVYGYHKIRQRGPVFENPWK